MFGEAGQACARSSPLLVPASWPWCVKEQVDRRVAAVCAGFHAMFGFEA